jgi:DNA-binding response OmpR family regulator
MRLFLCAYQLLLREEAAMPAHILIVDDDPAILEGITILLTQDGYRVSSASSGKQALSLLSSAPQLVVLDVMLPDIDGHVLCRHIRQLTPYIPILMLSARDELADKVIGLEFGADDYVTKPFEPRELRARVRAILRFAEQGAGGQLLEERPLLCGSIALWPAQHCVKVDDQAIDLTPKEWALLELFMRHPGQVFGRETLLRTIWGYDFLGDSRTVDVHVQRLRAKLEASAARYIQTVRGFGYCFTTAGEERNS